MRRTAETSARHAIEHIAKIAHKRARNWRCIQPAGGGRAHLQTTGIILFKDRQQTVVGVFTWEKKERQRKRMLVQHVNPFAEQVFSLRH